MPMPSWTTRAGKNVQSRSLMALCFVIFLVYLAQAVYMAIVPLYLTDQGYDPAGVGIVVFANLIASSALSIPFGVVSDRVGRKKTVAFGTAVAALGWGL